MTLPSATQFPAISFKRGVTDKVYHDHSALLWDIVEIMKTRSRAACRRGREIHPDRRAALQLLHGPEVARMDSHRNERGSRRRCSMKPIQADNAASRRRARPGVTLAIHLCRGNNRSHWYAEGGYDAIAEKLFRHAGRRSLPARIRRRALRHVRAAAVRPERQDSRAGIGQLEACRSWKTRRHCDRRIDEAARYVPLENLALSPQCGFASTVEGNLLTEDEQWAKLQLVVETARRIWAS